MTGKPFESLENTLPRYPVYGLCPKSGIRTNEGPVQSGVRAHSQHGLLPTLAWASTALWVPLS